MSMNDIKKLQQAGFYRDVDISDSMIIDTDADSIQEEIDELQGVEPSYGESDQCELYEIHTDLDIPGNEDLDAECEPTGIKLPYVVTVSEAVVGILVDDLNCARVSKLSIGIGSSIQKGLYFSTDLAILIAEGKFQNECNSSITSILFFSASLRNLCNLFGVL